MFDDLLGPEQQIDEIEDEIEKDVVDKMFDEMDEDEMDEDDPWDLDEGCPVCQDDDCNCSEEASDDCNCDDCNGGCNTCQVLASFLKRQVELSNTSLL